MGNILMTLTLIFKSLEYAEIYVMFLLKLFLFVFSSFQHNKSNFFTDFFLCGVMFTQNLKTLIHYPSGI